jgi:N-acetylglucosamine-6-phosphate deacetylase
MRKAETLLTGCVVLADRMVERGAVLIRDGRIKAAGEENRVRSQATADVEVMGHDGYVAPGYIDIHVHGGGGADFMDGTAEAFQTVLRSHLRHGTTSMLPTTTVARHEQTLVMLECCRAFRDESLGNARGAVAARDNDAASPTDRHGGGSVESAVALPRVLGAHLYGPHFRYEARGCHPAGLYHEPLAAEETELLQYADAIAVATIAPELPQAERFAIACRELGIRLNAGHSLATFQQMRVAVDWGVRHVDHLYCAMSDKTKLRAIQAYPMQGGVQEATLFFDELTTEVIADGKHLSADLLLLAHRIKGADRLALVTDCSRALDMPEGEYVFGPRDGGESFIHRDGVGMMPDGKALASSVQGMDHMVRAFHSLTGVPLHEVVRMATLTPARIIGVDRELGSLDAGKHADILLLDGQLRIQQVMLAGKLLI